MSPSRRLVVIVLLLLCAAAPPLPADTNRWKGAPLVEALDRLERAGLRLLYSSAVVRPDLRVSVEPSSIDPHGILEEILKPLGLSTQRGPGGAILILGPAGGGAAGRLRGRVVSAARGAPIARARVTILETGATAEVRPDGSFEIEAVPAGTYEVTVEAPGYAAARALGVRIAERGSADLTVRLQSGPELVEEIVVTPIRHALVPPEPNLRSTLDHDDTLLAPEIGGDVGRIVDLLPGIAGADNSAAFNARGAQTQDVSLLLDGLELYEPFHLESLQSPFSLIDSRHIDRIEFLGGGFTAEFGDRHGGFVELSTAAPRQEPETHVEAGSINSRVSFSAPTSFGSAVLSARAWYPEALRNTIEAGEDGLAPRFGDAYLKLSFHAGPGTVISVHGMAAYDRLRFTEPGGAESIHLDNRSGHAWVRALKSWSDAVLSDTVLSAGRIDQFKEGISDPDDGPLAIEDRRTLDFFGFKHDMSWEISSAHLLRGGFQLRPLQATYRYESLGPAASTHRQIDPSGTAVSLYLAHRVSLFEPLAMELGARWDRQSHTRDSQFSPRLNAVWRAGDDTEVRVGLGRYYQSQRINELDIQDGEIAFLEAELAEQAALTLQHRFESGHRLRLDAYARSISHLHPRYENLFNPIELFPESEADRVRIAPDSARLRGVELLVQGIENRAFHWWASYACSRAEDRFGEEKVLRSWDQTHAGKFLIGYRRQDRWSVALTGVAHTGWPTTPVTGMYVSDPSGGTSIEEVIGSRNSDRLPSYLRFDLKASRLFALPHGSLRVSLDILNLTDRRNACCVDEFDLRPLPNGDINTIRRLDYWLGTTGTLSLLYEF